jgi:type IV secretory pathway VirB10-like protein
MSGCLIARAIRHSQDTVSDIGHQLVRRQFNIQPTLTIRPGFPAACDDHTVEDAGVIRGRNWPGYDRPAAERAIVLPHRFDPPRADNGGFHDSPRRE